MDGAINLLNVFAMEEELGGQETGDGADASRLSRQLDIVATCLGDGSWWTLPSLAERAAASTQSVSARVRDLRKERWGSHTIERRKVVGSVGVYEYRMVK
jgi:hypothetical protein